MPVANYRAFSSSTRSLAFAIGFGYCFTHKHEMEVTLPEIYIVFSAQLRKFKEKHT